MLQRELTLDASTQVAGRAVFGVLGLVAYVVLAERGDLAHAVRAIGRDGLAIAALIAIASASFIVALNHTTVANVIFMQALGPLLASALAWLALREAVSRRTLQAMGIAVAGVAVMVGAPGSVDPLGQSLAFVMSLAFAVTIVLARRSRHVSMAPATCLAQALLLVAFAPFSDVGAIGGRDLLLLMLLGFGQMALSLVFFTIGARLISAAEVALICLVEIVLAPLWVWFSRSERPSVGTLVGGAVVLVAVVYQALPSRVEYPR